MLYICLEFKSISWQVQYVFVFAPLTTKNYLHKFISVILIHKNSIYNIFVVNDILVNQRCNLTLNNLFNYLETCTCQMAKCVYYYYIKTEKSNKIPLLCQQHLFNRIEIKETTNPLSFLTMNKYT